MVVALLALFVALGGTTYAVQRLPKRSVGAAQLRRDAVRNKHIKAGAVSRSKIRRKAVTSDQVGTDALLGRNVLESSLAKVPDADKLDGRDASRFVRATRIDKFALGGGETTDFYTTGPLTLRAQCSVTPGSGPDSGQVVLTTSQDGTAASGTTVSAPAMNSGDPPLVIVNTGPSGGPAFKAFGNVQAAAPDGTEIPGASLYAGVNLPGFADRCVFGGYVFE
jgi:hypothetical protein